jgi:hypothetical protein
MVAPEAATAAELRIGAAAGDAAGDARALADRSMDFQPTLEGAVREGAKPHSATAIHAAAEAGDEMAKGTVGQLDRVAERRASAAAKFPMMENSLGSLVDAAADSAQTTKRIRAAIEADIDESLEGMEYFLHGTTADIANGFSLEAGRRLFAATDPEVARLFAKRTVEKMGTGEPGFVAVVLPREVVQHLRATGQLTVRPVSDIPHLLEWIFSPGAQDAILKHGYLVTLPKGVP